MIMKVTREGVTIPRRLFGEATEVDVRQEEERIVLVPVAETETGIPPAADDPIWEFGKNPVDLGVTDASVNLDKYLADEMTEDHAP